MLYLITQAFGDGPEPDPAGPSRAESLRHVVPPDAVLAAGWDDDALGTLAPCGRVFPDANLVEVRHGGFAEETRRHAYVDGADHSGWEPRRAVVARVDAAVRFWLPRAGMQPLVIAAHRMALTLWLATVVPIPDPGAFWAALRTPDVLELNPHTRAFGRVASTSLLQAP